MRLGTIFIIGLICLAMGCFKYEPPQYLLDLSRTVDSFTCTVYMFIGLSVKDQRVEFYKENPNSLPTKENMFGYLSRLSDKCVAIQHCPNYRDFPGGPPDGEYLLSTYYQNIAETHESAFWESLE